MRAKSFLQASLGILALALAYHFGATTATAQAPGNPIVSVAGAGSGSGGFFAMTSGGDSYFTPDYGQTWYSYSNAFSGPTPVQRTTFGELKARYRGERESQGVKPSTGR